MADDERRKRAHRQHRRSALRDMRPVEGEPYTDDEDMDDATIQGKRVWKRRQHEDNSTE